MYLLNDGLSGYDRDGTQIRRRGLFLILAQPPYPHDGPIKVCVRKVALRQLGCWMMGSARIYGERVGISGAYGSDGLPTTVPQDVYDRLAVELPKELYDAWNKGEGWNSCGKEAPSMREWALANLEALRK